MNNQFMLDKLQAIYGRISDSVYWGEPTAYYGDVESLELLRDVMILLGWTPNNRVGMRVMMDGEMTNYIIIHDEPDCIRLYDLDDAGEDEAEFDFETEYEYQYWLEHGERPQNVNGETDND